MTGRFHLHRWGRWQDGVGRFNAPLLPKLGSWSSPVQFRRCTKCGQLKMRRID